MLFFVVCHNYIIIMGDDVLVADAHGFLPSRESAASAYGIFPGPTVFPCVYDHQCVRTSTVCLYSGVASEYPTKPQRAEMDTVILAMCLTQCVASGNALN